MINEIIEAIATQLGGIFKPPEYHYYIEDTDQNLIEPCFIIKRESGTQRERLGDRVLVDELYSVSFLCSENVTKLREVTEFVELNLRFIELQDEKPIMTHNRNSVLVGDDASVVTFEITRSVWFEYIDPIQEKLIHTLGVLDGE